MTRHDQQRRFETSTVLLGGGGHGIGKAAAHRLAAEGARVIVGDLDLAAARATAAELAVSAGGEHHAVELDVTRADRVARAFETVAELTGHLDAVVHTAGGATVADTGIDSPEEAWEEMISLNLLGAVRVCRHALPLLRASDADDRSITVTSSVNGRYGLGNTGYSAAKAALESVVRNLAAEVAVEGIRVNAVVPGTVRTRVWDGQEGGADRLQHLYPLGRVGEPEEIAAALAFLASADATWITGIGLPVDGGMGIVARQTT